MRGRAVAVTGAVLIVAGLVLVGVVLTSGDGPATEPAVEPRGPATAMAATSTTTTTVPIGHELHEAACAEGLVAGRSWPIRHPLLVEVSGVAVSGGTTWVHNDSGDRPRVYGIAPDGTTRVVDLDGAEAVDWEDLAIERGATPEHDVLWVGDIGGNIAPRASVQLYRAPVPAADVTSVPAERTEVTIPDGHRDFESLMVEPDGSLLLASKGAGVSHLYRVIPPAGGGAVEAVALGSFTVGDGTVSELTSADLAPDGSAVVLRTYGSVFVVPVRAGESTAEALADHQRRCRGIPPLEVQGEAIGFLPDGSGYVSMGEAQNPILTTVRISR